MSGDFWGSQEGCQGPFRTHLEPDILECEVKWALGSITTNKASGGDGISAELPQILKNDPGDLRDAGIEPMSSAWQVDGLISFKKCDQNNGVAGQFPYWFGRGEQKPTKICSLRTNGAITQQGKLNQKIQHGALGGHTLYASNRNCQVCHLQKEKKKIKKTYRACLMAQW